MVKSTSGVGNPADEWVRKLAAPKITWGRQYNISKIFKYKCNIHFQHFKVISGTQFF